ncbi:MAG: hypothetical protein ACYCSP_01380 [Acidobacteriaceae bacterium]
MSERSRAMHERRKDVFIGSLPGIIRFSSKSSKRDRAEKCSGMRYPGRCGMAFRTIASTSVQIPEEDGRVLVAIGQSISGGGLLSRRHRIPLSWLAVPIFALTFS